MVDPHHVDADPNSDFLFVADPDADLNPNFHPDADPESNPSFKKMAQTLEKVLKKAHIAYILA